MSRVWPAGVVIGLMVVFLLGVAVPGMALVDARGSDETHDIATWNWQDFPKEGVMTVNYLTLLINDLDMDLFVLQEIDSIEDYEQLISNLSHWDGIYSPDTYGGFYVKTGVLYNTDKVEIGEMVQLFADEDITRPPIMVPVTMFENGDTLSFNLIALHLKALYQAREDSTDDYGSHYPPADSVKGQAEVAPQYGNQRPLKTIGQWVQS